MLDPSGKSTAGEASVDLAFTLVALLRADGHLGNVLTHVSSGDWRAIELAIRAILDPRAAPQRLTGIARNILELVCDEGGVTGRLMRPFFFSAVASIAVESEMRRLEAQIQRLRRGDSCDPPARPASRTPRQASRREARSPDARLRPLSAIAAAPQQANGASP